VQDKCDDPGCHHAEYSLPSVPPAVDKHQAHILEVAHGTCEELHQGVGQTIAGQHYNRILLDCGYAPVEGLERMLQGGKGGGEVRRHKDKFSIEA